MRAAVACPRDQKPLCMVRRYWCVAGMNSKKIALSTGWFPPVPSPMKAQNVAMATKLGEPAPIRPAIEDISNVMLNAGFRPMKSADIGQTLDPTTSPAYLATESMAIRLTLNSFLTGGVMMVIACIQNCEDKRKGSKRDRFINVRCQRTSRSQSWHKPSIGKTPCRDLSMPRS